jgi:predicted small lipoprotein YifL
MNQTILKTSMVLVLFLLAGCGQYGSQPVDPPNADLPDTQLASNQAPTCEELTAMFEENLGKGRPFEPKIVGGTLLQISEPKYVESEAYGLKEYLYGLTFQAKTKTTTFEFYSKFVSKEPPEVPLTEGTFYSFDLDRAFGIWLSSGPHNGMSPFSEISSIFTPVSCE